jgi:hypothetical protein
MVLSQFIYGRVDSFCIWNCNILQFMPEPSPFLHGRRTWTLHTMSNSHFYARNSATDRTFHIVAWARGSRQALNAKVRFPGAVQ